MDILNLQKIKRNIIIIPLLMICTLSMAQTKGYKMTYQQRMNFSSKDINTEDRAMSEMIMNAMKDMKAYFTLTFSEGKSLFEADTKKSTQQFGGFSNIIYTDINNNKKITQENSFGKRFLIEDTLENFAWTITGEAKNINGHNCTKAVLTVNSNDDVKEALKDVEGLDLSALGKQQITAWYSAEIPIPCGPMGFAGLPGLIAELDMNNIVYTLESIEVINDVKEIVPPSKGKKVTAKEYAEIQKKKLEEIKSNGFGFGEGGNVRVIVR